MNSSDAESSKKTCAICKYSSDTTTDCILFGEWMQKQNVTVHYFCLLLSTHLPQNGKDCSGILGFLIRDIRKEIQAAAQRQCVFCHKRHASIRCRGCKDYFHLYCGTVNGCVSQFDGRFDTYCADCMPLNEIQRQWKKQPPPRNEICHICRQLMDYYSPAKWIYAPCCGNGFAHRVCMLQYALSAGYYLKCIWCRSGEFRDLVRLQGIFVPDRDAQWERQKDAYAELHRGHQHCDAERCRCPRGRDYVGGKWKLINCALCGSVGAHNPQCAPGREKSKQKLDVYKCEICSTAEQQRTSNHIVAADSYREANFETTLYQCKQSDAESQSLLGQTPTFSDEDSMSSKESSVITMVPRHSIVRAPPPTTVAPTLTLLPPPSPLKINKAAAQSQSLPTSEAASNAVDALEDSLIVVDLCTQTEEGGTFTPTITTPMTEDAEANKDCDLNVTIMDEWLEESDAEDEDNVDVEDDDEDKVALDDNDEDNVALDDNDEDNVLVENYDEDNAANDDQDSGEPRTTSRDEDFPVQKTTWIDETYVAETPSIEKADMIEWLCSCTDFCPPVATTALTTTTSVNAVADDAEKAGANNDCELNVAVIDEWLQTSFANHDNISDSADDEDPAEASKTTSPASIAVHNKDGQDLPAKKVPWIDEAYVAESPAAEYADMIEWFCTCTDFCPAVAAAKVTTPAADDEDTGADISCQLNAVVINERLETSDITDDDDISVAEDVENHVDDAETTTDSLDSSPNTADTLHSNDVEMGASTAVEKQQDRVEDLAARVEEALHRSKVEIDGNFATFWMFDFVEGDKMCCTGQSKIRIDLASSRFAGKTIVEILSGEGGEITDDDVIERSDDIGIFAAIDRIIERSI